ncbi:MAG: hypothetical protein KGP35_03555 [Bacteroidetes bacterium]|nr:hypothetical protein [Bacteroidota bacterium]
MKITFFVKPGLIPGLLFFLTLLLNQCFAQVNVKNDIKGEVYDIDSNRYQTFKIGNQIWMAENLRVSRFRNGIPIPLVSDSAKWSFTDAPGFCYYQLDATFEKIYGKLYNWYALSDKQLICPVGWHVPTDSEWKKLEKYLGMPANEIDEFEERGIDAKVGDQLKRAGFNWGDSTVSANHPKSGFDALPGGYRTEKGNFNAIGTVAMWWTSSSYTGNFAWSRTIYADNAGVDGVNLDKRNGLSVRCVKD